MAKLHYYYSAMNAGKSALLLQSAYNYKERGMETLLFTPQIDTRFEQSIIHSRIGLTQQAHCFDTTFNFYDFVCEIKRKIDCRCLLIDEAQFLTKDQVFQLASIVDELNLPVLTYGIRSDFRAEPFEGSLYLMTIADQIIELKTVCHCGKKATMNMRINNAGEKVYEGAQIEIGGNDKYVATCRKHFFEGNSGIRVG